MKAEFELNLDSNGRPCIKFKHHDKDGSLEQKALKVFLDAVKEKDACLKTQVDMQKWELQIVGKIMKYR